MDRKYDVLCALDTCVDVLVQCGQVVPEFGQKEQLIEGYEMELGGSNGIFGCQAAKLGLQVAGIGVVGGDFFGSFVREKLKEAGVDITYLQENIEKKTALGITLCRDDGDRGILTYLGTLDEVEPWQMSDELLLQARHLHIGSYYLMGKIRRGSQDLVRRAKSLGLTVSLDTNWDPEEKWGEELWELLPMIDVFLPNDTEIQAITKEKNLSRAMEMLGRQVPVVAVKCGGQGARAYSRGQWYTVESSSVPVVDTVGAGDSFDGGFLYGYLNGRNIKECLQIGCFCGSHNVTKAGGVAGQPTLEQWLDFTAG